MMGKYRIMTLVNFWFVSKYTLPKSKMTCKKETPIARVTKKEYETLAAFRYNLRHFLCFSESAAESAGLTSRQYQALLAIKGFPGRDCVTVGELAEKLQSFTGAAITAVGRGEFNHASIAMVHLIFWKPSYRISKAFSEKAATNSPCKEKSSRSVVTDKQSAKVFPSGGV
jgi:hypothetical protein